jgi:predicted nucleic acid-binding protein
MSILDASVILKWFVDEESSDQALRIRDEFCRGEREIVVPDLLLLEVANALRYNPTFSVAPTEAFDHANWCGHSGFSQPVLNVRNLTAATQLI